MVFTGKLGLYPLQYSVRYLSIAIEYPKLAWHNWLHISFKGLTFCYISLIPQVTEISNWSSEYEIFQYSSKSMQIGFIILCYLVLLNLDFVTFPQKVGNWRMHPAGNYKEPQKSLWLHLLQNTTKASFLAFCFLLFVLPRLNFEFGSVIFA